MRSIYIAATIVALFVPIAAKAADCDSLRRACQMRGELGERGQGNCERYRDQCQGGSSRQDHCTRLREACMFKRENGEEGQGNCQRYRDECR